MVATMKYLDWEVLALVWSRLVVSGFAANLHVHDASFVPDNVLRISSIDLPIACTSRQSTVVNGTSPGPLLTLKAGQTNWIRVYNDMTNQNATIHWHGLSQSVAPFSDGTPMASQWPIAPGHYFDYEVHPSSNEAGTYFYHSHVQFQTVSASGPLVVEEAYGESPPYSYDEERIFFVTELYNETDQAIVDGLIGAPFVWSGEPQTILVNGHGFAAPNATGTGCAPEVFTVEPDKTYRFRFIGGVALSDIEIAIDQHPKLSIIEADGAYTKPAEVGRMQVDSGQRFDVLLKTMSAQQLKKSGRNQFWIQLNNLYRPTTVTNYALLRYSSQYESSTAPDDYYPGTARKSVPSVPKNPPNLTHLLPPNSNETNTWLEYTLTPLKPNGFPSADEVSRTVYLTNVQLELNDTQVPFDINNHTWVAMVQNSSYMTSPKQMPYLVNIYNHGQSAIPSIENANQYFKAQEANGSNFLPTGWDPKFNAYPAHIGEVIDIVLLNEAGFANTFDVHPWHAHGGHYYDLGSGPGMYNATANNAYLSQLHAERGYVPALRDTTMLYRYPADNNVNDTEYTVSAWRAWRIRVEDPGVWMIHCHSLQHQIMGMQTVWVMGNASQITSSTLAESQGYFTYGDSVTGKPAAAQSGMEGYLAFGGSAYGNADRAPLVNHYFDS